MNLLRKDLSMKLKNLGIAICSAICSLSVFAEDRQIITDPLGDDQFYINAAQVFDDWAIVVLQNVMIDSYVQLYVLTESTNKRNSAISIVCGRFEFKPSHIEYRDSQSKFNDKLKDRAAVKINGETVYGNWVYKGTHLELESESVKDVLANIKDNDFIHVKYDSDLYTFSTTGFTAASENLSKQLPKFCDK